jgi:hypothetical protein
MLFFYSFFHGWGQLMKEIFEVKNKFFFFVILKISILARFRLLILIIGLISLLAVIAQLIFQSILLARKPYGHTLTNCMYDNFLEKTKVTLDRLDF